MELSQNLNKLTITGNIKTVSDFQDIKNLLDEITASHNSVVLHIVDSISITSSVIGYFNKLVLKDEIDLQINIGTEELLELFDDLNLTDTFKAKKIQSH
mgnify:CR=1 FL=1